MADSSDALDLGPCAAAAGSVALPGSKSISNRVLLLAALADGVTQTQGLLDSDDTRRMLEALAALGVRCERVERSDEVRIHGAGGRFPVKRARLFLGNAGTAFRPLTAVLALADGHYELAGVPRMHERPIGDLVDALRPLGADIRYLGSDGYPPLAIGPAVPGATDTVRVRGDVSSQFLTALLLALPLTGRGWTIEVAGELISRPYVEITLNLLARFGVRVEREGWRRFAIAPGQRLTSPGRVLIEGDASSASYFLAAGAIAGGPVRVTGVGRDSIQGDVRFAEVLERMGARIDWGGDWIEARGGRRLAGIDADVNHIPDAAMTLAVVALFADATTTLRNIGSWRVKETDRIAAMATELAKLGAGVETGDDWLRVTPPARLRPAEIATYDDHRIAMCFSLAAFGGVRVRILDPGCVAKTFPDYFDRFRALATAAPARGQGAAAPQAPKPATRSAKAAAAAPAPAIAASQPATSASQPAIAGSEVVAGAAAPRIGAPEAEPPVIAVDGPAASGKGTIAAAVARALGFHLLDSGSLYRLVALQAVERGVDPGDEAALAVLANGLDARFDGDRILLEGRDASDAIRSEAVSAAASRVAVHPSVRTALLARQRAFRRPPGLVADGRDMGTVVFPFAALKVYVTASPEERALRRHKQLMEKGNAVSIDSLLRDIRERDARDAGRTAAPLRAAADALLLDTTQLSPDEAVAFVLEQCRRRGIGRAGGG